MANYKPLGVPFDRTFRNDLNENFSTIDAVASEAKTNADMAIVDSASALATANAAKSKAEQVVYRDKTSFYDVVSENLYNEEETIVGYLNPTTGELVVDNNYRTSNYIPVQSGSTYITNKGGYVAFYNANKDYLNSILNSGEAHVVPVNAVFARVTDNLVVNSKMCYWKTGIIKEPSDFRVKDKYLTVDEGNISPNAKINAENMSFLSQSSVNLFNKNNLYDGYYLNTGAFVSDTNYKSCIIAVSGNRVYKKKFAGIVTFRDVNNDFISSLSVAEYSTFTTPANAVYLTDHVQSFQADFEYILDTSVLSDFTDYMPPLTFALENNVIQTKWKDKKWNVLGDSITAAYYCYWAHVAGIKGIKARNYGISGSAISSGGFEPMSVRYATMDDDADLITVFGGTNDFGNDLPLGTNSDTTNSTFYGALDVLYRGLITKYLGKKIAVFTPLPRRDDTGGLKNYVNAIKEVAERYSIPVLDLYSSSGLQPKIDIVNTTYFVDSDGLHPNNEGHMLISTKISSFIETL